MKKYEIFLDEEKEHFTTSLVKDPAIEQTLLYFKDEKPSLFFNEEKKIIYSIAMRPNKLMFRKNINGEPAEVFYSKETVEKFQQKYFKFNGQSKTNINHSEEAVKDVYPFESWIVMNRDVDKSKLLGLDSLDGDLIMGFKVENQDIWEQCKSGNIDGLSIEAHFKNSEIKTDFNMSKPSKLERVTAFFKELFAEEEEKTPEQIAKEEEEKAKAEKMAEEEAAKNAEADKAGAGDEEKNALIKENEELKAKIAELEAKITSMEAEKVKSETELETMKSQKDKIVEEFEAFKSQTPAAKPVPRLPQEQTKPYEQMTNYEKLKFNRENRG